MMETVEYFSDFLSKIGTPNFLAIGIVLIVLWLLISGIRKGLRKGGHGQKPTDDNDRDGED
jgi:hypothetical protein